MWIGSDSGVDSRHKTLSMRVAVVHLFIQNPENVRATVVDDALSFRVRASVSECLRHLIASPKLQSGVFALHTKTCPCRFHLISDHRLCSPVIIRKYLFQTFCASNIILWLKETIPAMSKRQRWKKYVTFEKCTEVFTRIGGLGFFFFFFSVSNQISLTSACQQPNHQITYMQHILNQMWASYHNNPNKAKLFTGRGP